MATTSISTKGQVTLPVGLRRKLGLKPRDRVLVEFFATAPPSSAGRPISSPFRGSWARPSLPTWSAGG